MDQQRFLAADYDTIRAAVQAGGLNVVVFPINGTRRWYMLEHPPQAERDMMQHYMDVGGEEHIRLYRMFFQHGVRTLLTPVFGSELLTRGDAYVHMAVEGMKRFVRHEDFLTFYEEEDVRVRFYGEYRQFFAGTPFAELIDLFDEIADRTAHHKTNRLFIGVCANDTVAPVSRLSIEFYTENKRIPTRDELISLYYGEAVDDVDIFIGFDRFSVFDMPLLANGEEDLYFTVAPSLYLTETQLRTLLYDHLFTRRTEETDYSELSADDWTHMRAFYQANAEQTLGVGAIQSRGNYWYPLPQVILPPNFEGDK